jgi:diguanylate cyclase (GGDEF)-like protein
MSPGETDARPPSKATDVRRESIGHRLGQAFRAIRITMVVLTVIIAGVAVYVLADLRPQQLKYSAGDRAVQLAHQAMIDEETGLRGYLLFHDPVFLEPYRAGVDALRARDDDAGRELGGDASTAPLLLDMRVAQQAWISQWALVVADNRAPADETELRRFLADGKALFDQYRATQTRLDGFLDDRRQTLQQREGLALAVGLGSVLVVALLLGVVMERQRRRLQQMLVRPVDAIVATTERIAAGDLDAQVSGDGPAEFERIARSVNAMSAALVDARAEAVDRRDLVERQADQLRKILTMAREIAGSLSLPYVLRAVATSAADVSGFDRVTVWLLDSDAHIVDPAFDTLRAASGGAVDKHVEIGVGVVGLALKFGRTSAEVAAEEPSVEVHPERPLGRLAIPLVVGAQITGAIELESSEPAVLGTATLDVIETLAIHAAAAIEAARLHSHTEQLGKTDALTSLANRRSFDADIAFECERCARYHRPLALIMFDVDHFKKFNDTFGHQRGDEILQEVARTVRQQLRNTDSAYRYGGEEFAVLARETSGEEAAVLAERLRSRIEAHFSAQGSPAPVTASFGIALVPPEEAAPRTLIEAADRALYAAKQAGRNCVQTARAPGDEAMSATPVGPSDVD